VHLAVGLVDVLGEMGLKEVLRERRMRFDDPVQMFLIQEVTDGVVNGDDGRLLPVLAHERNDAEGVSLAPEVDNHVLSRFRLDRDPHAALLDDPKGVARRSVLLQDDRVLGIELHG